MWRRTYQQGLTVILAAVVALGVAGLSVLISSAIGAALGEWEGIK